MVSYVPVFHSALLPAKWLHPAGDLKLFLLRISLSALAIYFWHVASTTPPQKLAIPLRAIDCVKSMRLRT